MPSKLFSALGLLCLLGAASLPGSRPAQAYPGEYGLWVEDRRDSLVVHWITAEAVPGALHVSAGNTRLNFATPADNVHAIAFRRPRGPDVVLSYGDRSHQATTTVSLETPKRAHSALAMDSIYVVGDTHGEFDKTLTLLRNAGVVDAEGHWRAGRKQLVFVGDLTDRGPDVNRLLWFVYGLERQAQQAGGRVHVVLGNHESMVFTHDLRYVHNKELQLAHLYRVAYPRLYDIRESVLGKWLAAKPGILRLGDILFAHGGVSADYLGYNTRMFDDSLARFMGEDLFYTWADTTVVATIDSAGYHRRANFFFGENSVFWYRGYVLSDTLGTQLDRVLKRFDASLHVVAHTPTPAIHQRYHGKLVAAHPRTPAIELLLLARHGAGWQRIRIDASGARTGL